ncbi:MAG TPA: HEAT repeat domain-containing protein, partial [Gemmatimonadaceae bacterium]|nr:HEAT repeat domain-containing protein [Gemmatimonadaceae bacterium]
VDSLGASADPFVINALVDENPMVRWVARDAARKRALIRHFAMFYRERAAAADSPCRVAAAVGGLGEVGTAADVATLVELLAHDKPRVRAAAAYALARVDQSAAVERLPGMLNDSAPGVTHAVRDALQPLAVRVGADKIAALLESVETKHGRRDAFLLGTALSKWDALPLLIEGAADGDEDIRTLASMALQRWLDEQNRTFVQPTRRQVAAIDTALQSRRLALQRSQVDELGAILAIWRP